MSGQNDTKLIVNKKKKEGIFYAHIEPDNKKFMHEKAKEQGVSVSELTNELINKLREGKAVSL